MIWWILIAVLTIVIAVIAGFKLYAMHQERIFFGIVNREHWENTYSKWVDFNNSSWPIGILIVLGIVLFFMILIQTSSILEYNAFVTEFEILREQYNMIDNLNPELLNVYDIGALNKELAAMQAHYLQFGYWWTVVPEEVMNILPIGV